MLTLRAKPALSKVEGSKGPCTTALRLRSVACGVGPPLSAGGSEGRGPSLKRATSPQPHPRQTSLSGARPAPTLRDAHPAGEACPEQSRRVEGPMHNRASTAVRSLRRWPSAQRGGKRRERAFAQARDFTPTLSAPDLPERSPPSANSLGGSPCGRSLP